MFTALRKIQKEKGVNPTDFEESVAQVQFGLVLCFCYVTGFAFSCEEYS